MDADDDELATDFRMKHIFAIATLLVLPAAAAAEPPASCADKFIGQWRHQGPGEVNMSLLTEDGTAACSGNAACTQGTWTCDGNVLTYNNGFSSTQYTLVSPNTMTACGGACVATRVGPARRKVGTMGGDLYEADTEATSHMRRARAARQICTYADKMVASGEYRNAADSFAKAGNPTAQRNALRLADLASAEADRCDRKRNAKGEGSPDAPPPPDCERLTDYRDKVAASGNDVSAIDHALAGCPKR